MLYHITDDGPKLCKARKRLCPYGGEHFSDLAEAAKVYEAQMSAIPEGFKKGIVLSTTTLEVFSRLDEAGARAYLVGGAIRDHMLGYTNKDIDIEVYGSKKNGESLDFDDLKRFLPRSEGFVSDDVGVSFAVLKVTKNKEEFDISFPRTEMSTGAGHKDYEVNFDSRMTIEEASSRRDFTINSMAYDPINRKLVDPHNGAQDLKDKILRHISPAFADDPLRCLRAVNFASRFDLDLHPETRVLCQQLSSSYHKLAHERVEEEFNKLFYKGVRPDKGLVVLHDINWTQQMPGFSECSREELEGYGKKLRIVPKTYLRKAVLSELMTRDGKKDPSLFLESSKSEQKKIARFRKLVNSLDKSRGDLMGSWRQLLSVSPKESPVKVYASIKAIGHDTKSFVDLDPIPKPPIVNGDKLIERGFAPGPEMGKVIRKSLWIQDNDNIEDFNKLVSRALESK